MVEDGLRDDSACGCAWIDLTRLQLRIVCCSMRGGLKDVQRAFGLVMSHERHCEGVGAIVIAEVLLATGIGVEAPGKELGEKVVRAVALTGFKAQLFILCGGSGITPRQ